MYKVILTMIGMMGLGLASLAQAEMRQYTVLHDGAKVGVAKLEISKENGDDRYKISSDITARFLLKFCVRSVEESVFRNNLLIYSSVNRTVNGSPKISRSTSIGKTGYHFNKEGKTGTIGHAAINSNVMMFYVSEPVNLARVYSDNHQQFLAVKKIGAHSYKLEQPDGYHNIYHYENGVCVRVQVYSKLYDMEMVLVNNTGNRDGRAIAARNQ